MKLFSDRKRPVHAGPYPIDRLPRLAAPRPAPFPKAARANDEAPTSPLAAIVREYHAVFGRQRDGPVCDMHAPIPDDPALITQELKAACYFLDASMVGVCELRPYDGDALESGRAFALVILVEHLRHPEPDNQASAWLRNADGACETLRSFEVACVIAGYVRQLGHAAHAVSSMDMPSHFPTLAVHSGLAVCEGRRVIAPFLGTAFAGAAVTTTLPLQPDRPLLPGATKLGPIQSLSYWLGIGGTRSGWDRWRRARRPSHLGLYPMESIRRVETPTTLIVDEEIPRVPKRANFFTRALHGDLGDKAKRERTRFATKHPLAFAMTPLMRNLVPLQNGRVAEGLGDRPRGSGSNARAIKSLAYHFGADMVGICRAKPYAWYSHDDSGQPISPYHENAIVLLIDQGHETMEGASGDDWISGAQSMRAYLRGAEIAGLLAAHIRALGYPARAHTNLDSHVLHIPLILLAGLGELSRIGELVLNPFVGPRFKSAVVTTNMPLDPDQPVDFGLQDMCSKCRKCARECPCNAISHHDKVMFNGYEMWKPDVERCVRYRLTNLKGSACGRCMKMCPYTNAGLVPHRFLLWCAIHLPFTRKWIADLDDLVRNGSRNPVKKWWSDLERLPDGTVAAASGVNRRDLNLAKKGKRPPVPNIAYYPANAMPPPNQAKPWPIDRAAALEASHAVETAIAALDRRRRGGARPEQNVPTPPRDIGPGQPEP